MSKDSNIRSYTAIDIEKYHKGLLSPREMHDLEKAALDDPFLADALEGYAVPGINTTSDIAELKKRLSDRMEEDPKVKPIAAPPHSFPWLRAAAMLILVLGAAFLVYQFGFNKDSSPIAKSENKEIPAQKDTNQSSYPTAGNLQESNAVQKQKADSPMTTISAGTQHYTGGNGEQTPKPPATQEEIITTPDTLSASVLTENLYYKKSEQAAVAPPTGKDVSRYSPLEEKAEDQKALRKQNQLPKETNSFAANKQKDTTVSQNNGYMRDMETASANRPNAAQNQIKISAEEVKNLNVGKTHVFRGQVVDADNNVVPFANITNKADNIGTYTDAKGNFILTSPDSVLNVQVRSLGYENNNSQLNNRLFNNQVVMQEDRSLKEVVISQKKVNSTRSRTSTMVLEEPEPVDGWTNYDAYLANNLNVPETWRSKQAEGGGAVTLSFEVNSKGQPVNITVDKSLCESCDKEAIRLIKEGPKWKRKSRKGRTSVTIAF